MDLAHACTVTVVIEARDLAAFAAGGASLYVLSAFVSSNLTAVPLVVEVVSPLSPSIAIHRDETWAAFAAYGDLSEGGAAPAKRTVLPGSTGPVRLGDVAHVGASLQIASASGGTEGAVTFRTVEPGRSICGLALGLGSRPCCAATLTAALDVMFAPTRALFLMFATSPFEAGAWIERTTSPGLLVDMADAEARTVTVDLDTPGGWREADQAWARAVPAGTRLTDLLRRTPEANTPL